MTEQIYLSQARDGRVGIIAHRNNKRRFEIWLTEESANHLAYRLMSFTSGQKTESELVLSTSE